MDSTRQKAVLAIAITALLSGCARVGPIVPYGEDTYIINADNMLGNRSKNYLQVRAIEKANAYCNQQGKMARVQNSTGAGAQMWGGTSANVIFTCSDQRTTK